MDISNRSKMRVFTHLR